MSELSRVPPADFSSIRYAQVWEDADVLLEGLDVQPGDACLSIASAGDNTLALLVRDPERVVAVDLSFAQLACLELRIAAYRTLEHGELLELMGSRPSTRRLHLYRRCRTRLSSAASAVWDAQPGWIASGIGSAGKFERYLRLFRRVVLPLVASRRAARFWLESHPAEERRRFYEATWDTWRWRLLFRTFFSRLALGRLGRDPSFFQYVDADVPASLLARTRHALADLDPAVNPYVHWILTGRHGDALPLALRPEHFDIIRARLDRVELRRASLHDVLDELGPDAVDRFNLSDVFEYMGPESYQDGLRALCVTGRSGGRLAYWNLLVTRRRPDLFADRLVAHEGLAARLHAADQAFFYKAFVVEEVA